MNIFDKVIFWQKVKYVDLQVNFFQLTGKKWRARVASEKTSVVALLVVSIVKILTVSFRTSEHVAFIFSAPLIGRPFSGEDFCIWGGSTLD